jgi:hypothetical protein
MNGFLSFRTLITSQLIKGMYIAGALLISVAAVGCIGVSIVLLFDSSAGSGAASLSGPLAFFFCGLLLLTFGNVAWRIMCESWILFFSVHEILATMDRRLKAIEAKATSTEFSRLFG